MDRPIRIAIVAGESSGDLLGAGLIRALKKRYSHVEFSGIGGPKMLEQGFHSFFPQDRLAVMGLVEPLKRLPELLKIRRFLFEHFRDNPPDVFIGIDSPDFNLTLEEKLRQVGVKTAHYVSPSVWAWRSGRIKKIKKAVDLMMTLLPFETEIYQAHGVPVTFVGHPLADDIAMVPDRAGARDHLQLERDQTYIALMPGSRHNEVEKLGPIFFKAAKLMLKQRPGLKFLVPAANGQRYKQLYQQLGEFSELPVRLVHGQSHEVMTAADAVLLASGTTALEAMLLKRPMAVAYKMAWLSFQILKAMATVKFVALPNLLAGFALVPELLQADATPEKVADAILEYFNNPDKATGQIEEFNRQHQLLAQGASTVAGEAIVQLIARES